MLKFITLDKDSSESPSSSCEMTPSTSPKSLPEVMSDFQQMKIVDRFQRHDILEFYQTVKKLKEHGKFIL